MKLFYEDKYDGAIPMTPFENLVNFGARCWGVASVLAKDIEKIPGEAYRVTSAKLEQLEQLRPTLVAKTLCQGLSIPLRNAGYIHPAMFQTMELLLPRGTDDKCAPWQQIKLRYAMSYHRILEGRPKHTISLQGWLQKYTGVNWEKEYPFTFRKIAEELMGLFSPEPEEQYSFRFIRGDEEGARETIARVYTSLSPNYTESSCRYPSVHGSCMRYDKSIFSDLGPTDPHPVEAYATEDIGLAWLEDAHGYTVARTLVNLSDPERITMVRFYSRVRESEDFTLVEHQRKQLVSGVRELYPSAQWDESRGLLNCRMLWIPLDMNNCRIVAPYLDCGGQTSDNAQYLIRSLDNPDVGVVSKPPTKDCEFAECTRHSQGTQKVLTKIRRCDYCGDMVDDFHYVGGEYWCTYCRDNHACYCEHCDNFVHEDNYIYDARMCSECYEDNYTSCHYCGRDVLVDDAISDHQGNPLCEACVRFRYSTCGSCGELYHENDIVVDSRGDYCFCPSCAEDSLRVCPVCGDTVGIDDPCCPEEEEAAEATND